MREETRRKLERVKDLLKRGYTIREALGEVGLGWKSYYKYEEYIYSDKTVPPPKRRFPTIKFGPYVIDCATSSILRDIAKREAQIILMRKCRRLVKPGDKEVRELAKALLNRWCFELIKDIIR